MNKKLLYPILAIALVFLIWRMNTILFPASENSSRKGGRPPVAVELGSVIQGPITEMRQLTGTVVPQFQYVIAPKVSGRILSIYKRIGDQVTSGELVAQIDAGEFEQNVLEAEANLKIAKSALIEAEIQLNLASQEKLRMEQLQEKGITSSSEWDAAISSHSAQESRFQLAQAQVEQRQAALNSAKIRQGFTQLTASQPGFVGERFVDEGALLAPNSPVITIVGIESVIIRTTIIERDYGVLSIGQAARISVDAYPDRIFNGQVARIAPMLQEASRVAQMEIEVPNPSLLLKPGMFARVEVITAQKDLAQIIPSRSIVIQNQVSGVFRVDQEGKTASFVPVTIGLISSDQTEVLSPELNGAIVTLGQHLLEDGSPVLIPEPASEDHQVKKP